MNWPAFFSRKYLRAAFVTIIVPKRFVSICARNSDRGVSSTDERLPYPALLMTTSSEPNTSTAAITAFAAAASSVTSIAKSLTLSPYRSDRSASDLMSRAVANTLLPAARPASTIPRPRPRELPVTNHTCAIHPPLSHRKRTDQCKELEDSDGAKQRSPGPVSRQGRGKTPKSSLLHDDTACYWLFSALLLCGAEKNRAHHGFNPGCHLLGGDTVRRLKPAARGSKNGPGRGGRG